MTTHSLEDRIERLVVGVRSHNQMREASRQGGGPVLVECQVCGLLDVRSPCAVCEWEQRKRPAMRPGVGE